MLSTKILSLAQIIPSVIYQSSDINVSHRYQPKTSAKRVNYPEKARKREREKKDLSPPKRWVPSGPGVKLKCALAVFFSPPQKKKAIHKVKKNATPDSATISSTSFP